MQELQKLNPGLEIIPLRKSILVSLYLCAHYHSSNQGGFWSGVIYINTLIDHIAANTLSRRLAGVMPPLRRKAGEWPVFLLAAAARDQKSRI
jgi:hypothetical protein